MTPEEPIFAEALTKGSEAERSAYLDVACAGNWQLRSQVEALLVAHQRSAGILETSPVALDSESLPSGEAVGSAIGPYKLLQQIGEGGMAVVFLAEQTRPLKRKVALKIIKPGMDSRQVISRFDAERQALALMDHPNIAKVLEAGTTTSGQPYFVMELVKGVPVTKYCDEHHVEPRQRLELFAQVCSAVQHAHTKGIIHRDLKPSNVLVALYDGKPVPKVIDFGIAKATGQQLTERTLFTGFGHVVGTPEYMSPEQAEMNQLDIDTRSDVYSLGVLLYELLTGSTPLDSKHLKERALMEVLRVIREEEPPKPSTRLSTTEQLPSIAASRGLEPRKLSVLVRGELDWIVMKALEKDRNRRYETANGLARDLERYLRDEPVQACPPSARYRLSKLARKHRASLLVGIGFVLLLIAATVVSSWQALRARRAELLAQSRLETEREARALAVTEAAKATTVSDLLQEMLTSANPDQTKGVDYTVRQLLDDSSVRLSDQLKGQPEVEAAVRAAIGNAYRRLVMRDKAEPHLQRALALRRELAAKAGSGVVAQELVAQSLHDYGWNLYMSGRPTDAERYLRESVAVYKANGVRNVKLLEALSTLQLSVDNQLRFRDAEAVANEALALGRELFPEGHGEIANVLHRLGGMKQAEGDLAAAEPLIRQSAAMHRRWHGDDHPETAWGCSVLGDLLFARGKHDEAAASYRQAQAIFMRQYDGSHPVVLGSIDKLERVLVAKGDQAGLATLRVDKAARLTRKLARETDGLKVRMQLGRFLRETGNLDDALANYAEANELTAAATPDLKHALATDCSLLARLLRDKQRPQQAEQMFRHAISLREPIGEVPPALRLAQANDYNDMAFVMKLAEQSREAEQAVRAGIELKQALVREFPADRDYRIHLAHSYIGLAHVMNASQRRSDAVEPLALAADLLNALAAEALAPEGFRVFLGHTFWQLGNAWGRMNRLAEADEAYQHALKTFAQLAADFPATAFYRQEQGYSHRHLFNVAQRAGRTADAQRHLGDALDFYRTLLAEAPDSSFYRQEVTVTALALADLYAQLGQLRQATDVLAETAKTADPTDQPSIGARAALLHLATQDEAGYRRTCATLVQQSLLNNPDGNAAFEIAWSCTLLPDAGVDADQVVRIAERAVARNAKDPDYLIALGAALYRAGRFEEAAKILVDAEAAYRWEQAAPTPGIHVTTTIIYSQLFLAMSHQRLGHHQEAARWLKWAIEAIDDVSPTSQATADPAWRRKVTVPILRKEAERLTAPATE